MSGKIVLYAHPVSQPSRAVMWALAMHNVEYEFKFVDLMKGEASSDEFLAKFPSGGVPAAEIDGVCLTEGAAILTYLAETRGWDEQYPAKDAAKRAKINQWLHWHHSGSRVASTGFFGPMVFATIGKQDPAGLCPAMCEKKKEFRDALLTMKFGALKDTPFLCGDKPTLADISLYCEFDQLEMADLLETTGVTEFPEIIAWMNRMKALPHHEEVRKQMPAMLEMIKPTVDKIKEGLKA